MLKLTWYDGPLWHERYRENCSIYSETGDRRRKHHRKSRNGCSYCRKRRVKCTEDKPACHNCARLQIDCLYPTKGSPTSTDSSTTEDVAADSLLVAAAARNQLWTCMDDLDMDLASFRPLLQAHAVEHMDHFVKCSQSWLKNPIIQDIMQHKAVTEVMAQPYLLHAVLATSAAHLSIARKDSGPSAVVSMVHWQRFMREYRRCFQSDLTSQNIDALFFASHLHSMLVGVHGRTRRLDGGWTIPDWVHSLQGVKILWDMPGVVARLRTGSWQAWASACERAHQDMMEEIEIATKPSLILVALQEYCDTFLTVEDALAHKGRIDLLSAIETHGSSPQGRNGLSWFIARAPTDYIARLRRSDEVSLLSLLYWCRLSLQIGQWWMAEAARNEMKELYAYVARVHGDNDMILSLLDAIVTLN